MTNQNYWLIVLPILLFVFKNLIPLICERVFSEHSLKGIFSKIGEELLQFPVDLLFIAISYTAPKIMSTIYTLSEIRANNEAEFEKIFDLYHQQLENLINYVTQCFIMLPALPFLVLLTKYAIKLGDEKKRCRQIMLTAVLYIVSIWAVIYSLYLYQ